MRRGWLCSSSDAVSAHAHRPGVEMRARTPTNPSRAACRHMINATFAVRHAFPQIPNFSCASCMPYRESVLTCQFTARSPHKRMSGFFVPVLPPSICALPLLLPIQPAVSLEYGLQTALDSARECGRRTVRVPSLYCCTLLAIVG